MVRLSVSRCLGHSTGKIGEFSSASDFRQDAAYILDTFPIIRRPGEVAFGHYPAKEIVLAYYNALSGDDTAVEMAA